MDYVPDGIIQHILSQLSNARDVAASACVSTRWNDCIPFVPTLYFQRNAFSSPGNADANISRMVAKAVKLEELIVYCPFSAAGLANWLALRGGSLRVLELRIDTSGDKEDEDPAARLDCINAAKGLEALRLWSISLERSPKWVSFERLRVLEIVGAALKDDALKVALRACPNLVDLALLGCDGVASAMIELQLLERCRLDFLGAGDCSLFLSSPRIHTLEIQGFSLVSIHPDHRLRSLCISKNTGRVNKIDLGKLLELKHLSIRGVQWSWEAISYILQRASEVKHLVMKIEFSGNFEALHPFPEIDLVEFFNNHTKLQKFEIHGAMFAALCQKNSLKNLSSRFVIPSLEEVVITVRSPLNPEQKLGTLELLLKSAVKLQKMVIRVCQMKNCHEAADEFFEEVCKLKYMNYKKVQIE